MHRNLTLALIERSNNSEDILNEAPSPDLFITKWIDYSNKYGLGYQLRDGSVGVYFNDSTSIILAADNLHFEYLYYDRRGSEKGAMHRKAHTLLQYPVELQKKVTLLKHFRGYMQNNLHRGYPPGSAASPKTQNLEFLTKYLRTKHGVIFRLSNHVVQLNLFDHTKLILSSDAMVVTYIDKNREFATRPLGAFASMGSKEVLDRLKYARDVLQQMILKKQRRTEGEVGFGERGRGAYVSSGSAAPGEPVRIGADGLGRSMRDLGDVGRSIRR
ncbi:Cell cycle serine/threonine-protein kinase cdc5/MSD2 [Borealophlyctis nickersoniae]|nr:Cell cycle serine/threonine-protein kinase cdc5/MSD2 [Borealophlyctis nickersoniae]